MEIKNQYIKDPLFSICIPQYNRTSFLIEACKVLAQQTFKKFEVCISDDQSNDGREQELLDYLKVSGLSFIYKKQEKNLRYDGNLRASIALAQGRYCFLHGNDDCLASPTTLETLSREIYDYSFPGVIITNFEDWETGQKTFRICESRLFEPGPETAATHFRNVAFVTGVILDRRKSQEFYTDRWDGSEMYQMYLTSRIIASGDYLLELDMSTARKDIQIPAESVDSYANKTKLDPCPIVERKLPMVLIGGLVADAISPWLDHTKRERVTKSIFLQLYLFTYSFWLVEYRRVQSWNYALGVCLGIHPKNTLAKTRLPRSQARQLYIIYLITSMLGLFVPIYIFDKFHQVLFSFSKALFTKKSTSIS